MSKLSFPKNIWKFLVVITLFLSLTMVWIIYSQAVYTHSNVNPIPENSPSTAVVINPLTGSFFLIPSQTLFSLFITFVILIVLTLYGKK